MRTRLRIPCFLFILLVLGAVLGEPDATQPLPPADELARPVAPQYAVPALDVAKFRQPAAVQAAVDFILSLQPAGTYILSRPGDDDVVPMDLAHAAIALTKAGHVAEASAALDWLLARQARHGDPGVVATKTVGDRCLTVDYSGSWYDHYWASGDAKTGLTRGRGEAVGLTLIAVDAVAQADPDYLTHEVAGEPVWAYVARSVGYLSRPALQDADGRFNHRPDYRVSFNEEGARMALGLNLAAKLLAGHDPRAAAMAKAHAALGLAALARGDGFAQGMAYDYYAGALWGLVSVPTARTELADTRATGLITTDGVRMYDWQVHQADNPVEAVQWWFRERVVAPSESFDWGIANLMAGNLGPALAIEAAWLPRQRADGGFADGYFLAFRLPVGAPTSYSAARFILFERLLTEATRSRAA